MPELFKPIGEPHHENRLTWAFLCVIESIPFLQLFLRNQVESNLFQGKAQINSSLGSVHVVTQRGSLGIGTTRIVSVLMTDDVSDCEDPQDIQITWRDENAIYDGVIEYPDGTTLIIENKPSHWNIHYEQLNPSVNSVENINDIELVNQPVFLDWSGFLENLVEYMKLNFSNFTAQKLINDFLSFVERFARNNHLNLTPYREFRHCDGDDMALGRRINLLIDEIVEHVNG